LIVDEEGIPADGRGSVVTVGTFDGVHRGHQSVLEEIRRRAAAAHGRSVLVTFDPHPLRVVRPDVAPRLLTTPAEKKAALAATGIDVVVFLSFTPELSRLSPREFVEQVLVARIGVTELVIGYDHGFGQGRAGDAGTLKKVGQELGFKVDVVAPVEEAGETISSSRIREAVERGDLASAHAWLGRPYSLLGRVVRGDGRGRTLGFPTANLRVEDSDKLLPGPGIYAALVSTPEHRSIPGALHLGPRPTFPGASPSIEVHLLDWSDDLYDREVQVDFIDRIRGVMAFDSPAALVDQMHRDVAAVRVRLAGTGVAGERERP
jgi:riboflavin kinase/FMN adenylyltransferase